MSNQSQAAQGISAANRSQCAQALLIQTYANSINEQPGVDFSGDANLLKYQSQINDGLSQAQTHATAYLNVIQPTVIANIADIGNYYALNNAVLTAVPAGSTEAQWIATLAALQGQSQQYQTAANGIVSALQTLHDKLTTDSASFSATVSDLNAAVNGDNGVLSSINSQLGTIQGQIDSAIAGTVLSGLAIVGGTFMVVVGGVADFVTAGTSTPLVVAGVAVVAAGVGGEVASAITLKNLNDEKATLLGQEASLTAEVKLATGISSGYASLSNQVQAAVQSATQMENAWEFLSSDLGSLISDLQQGIHDTATIRTLFLTAANTEMQAVTTDITTIKGQMTGVTSVVAAKGQTVGEAAVAAAA